MNEIMSEKDDELSKHHGIDEVVTFVQHKKLPREKERAKGDEWP